MEMLVIKKKKDDKSWPKSSIKDEDLKVMVENEPDAWIRKPADFSVSL